MANLHIDENSEIGNTKKTLKDLVNLVSTVTSLNTTVTNMKECLENTGLCILTGNSDLTINIPSNWANSIIRLNVSHYNSNTRLFQHYDGGIKILRAGFYSISISVNTDGYGSATPYTTSHGYFFTMDNAGSNMINHVFGPPLVLWLDAGAIVYCGFRMEAAGNHLVRGGRSMLRVERISHL